MSDTVDLPSALSAAELLLERLRSGALVVGLDFDGTLCPIVERPEEAGIDPAMLRTLDLLAQRCPVILLSGRALDDLRKRVGVPAVWYGGCHGLEIAGPRRAYVHPEAARAEPLIAALADELEASLEGIEGVIVERKRYAVAVHYRMVAENLVARVEGVVDIAGRGLVRKRGKKVYEFVPDAEWDKGRALRWIVDALGREDAFPLFIGDDRTDEDAFAVARDRGLAVLVSQTARHTAATTRLADHREVHSLLETLVHG